MKRTTMSFIVACFILALSPFTAYGLTFTLSNDAIMALDYDYYDCGDSSAVITKVTDVPGQGVRFDILFSDPLDISGNHPYIQRISSTYGGQGTFVGRDISMFDAFALKFTLLSAKGVSSPDAVGRFVIGSIINMPHDTWGFGPYWIAIDELCAPRSVRAVTTSIASQIDLIGITCYIWWYNESSPNPWDPCGATVSILVEPASDGVVMTSDPDQVFKLVSINKCTVAAGSKARRDKISFSGKMNPVYNDLDITNIIQIAIDANDMADPCIFMVPINNANYKKTGKLSYSGTDENGVKKSFKLDFKTHKFSFVAQNVNLSGLSCPLKIGVDIAGFDANTTFDETIVKPMPINFLMGVRDSLRVDKIRVKYGSKMNSDTLTVSSGFSAKDVDMNMAGEDVFVSLGSQTFTIPATSFKPNKAKTKFTCSNVTLDSGIGIAAATFDFSKCTFTLTIKKVSVEANPYDIVTFTMQCADFSANFEVEIP